jgi:hypothetical protein
MMSISEYSFKPVRALRPNRFVQEAQSNNYYLVVITDRTNDIAYIL